MVRGRSRVSTFKELQEKGHKKGDGVEGKEHFWGCEGSPYQDSGPSDTYVLDEHFQNPKTGLWRNELSVG